jgi:hypothetical protein
MAQVVSLPFLRLRNPWKAKTDDFLHSKQAQDVD